MSASTTPSGVADGADPRPAGAHIVRDPDADALVRGLFCCTPVTPNGWCFRVKGHAGGCIAWGLRPLKHIRDDNHSRAASIARHPAGKAL